MLKGIQAYFGAFQLISKLKLWKYFIIPIIISVLVGALIAIFAYSFSDNIGHHISSFWKWEFGKLAFEMISTFFSGLLIVVIGLVLYKHIVMALSAPFMSPVSEKIEQHFRGENHEYRKTSFQEQLIRGIRINVRNLLKELLFTIPILLLSIIPVIGIFFYSFTVFNASILCWFW